MSPDELGAVVVAVSLREVVAVGVAGDVSVVVTGGVVVVVVVVVGRVGEVLPPPPVGSVTPLGSVVGSEFVRVPPPLPPQDVAAITTIAATARAVPLRPVRRLTRRSLPHARGSCITPAG
jgi:hypothetical protein